MTKQAKKGLKWIITSGIVAMFVLIGTVIDRELVLAKDHQQIELSTIKENKEVIADNAELQHDDVIHLTSTFMDILVQDVDEKYKVKSFDTKEELLDEFEKVTARTTAQEYVDFYYMEEADGMYILPTETPPWFLEENDYDMIKVDDSTVKVVQENYTDLYGDYVLELEFTFDGDWKITEILYN
ncbi:hypothetical protein [Oceanobacillus damuensis]|uniref:hypothetical protein n=1 Tax=Oceanobacillus damuensis TaxID=937928 RepID=UPI0008350AE6|nr:hypothetical protein [Oceanobacillus damuensis]